MNVSIPLSSNQLNGSICGKKNKKKQKKNNFVLEMLLKINEK